MSYLETGENPVERRTPLVFCARYDEAFPSSLRCFAGPHGTVNGF